MALDERKELFFGNMGENWIHSVDGKLTLCGVLYEYFEDCSRYWSVESTLKSYSKDYDRIIFPALLTHDTLPLCDCTKEDFEEVLQNIKVQRTKDDSKYYTEYSDKRIQHFAHLLRVIVHAGAKHGVCSDVLWGSRFNLSETTSVVQDKIKEYVRLKKSLTPKEEHTIARLVLSNPHQRGQLMGLAMMYCCGLRNSEACAVNYGDIQPFGALPGTYILYVYKSTERDSNTVKGSGKTENADRILPVPDVLVQLLVARADWIKQQTGMDNIDNYPVACVGQQFDMRCSAPHLTAAARTVFHDAGLQEDQLAYIDTELAEKRLADSLGEKDASAYLLRRNFATHLYLLNLEEDEIQYILGHEIENTYQTRNEFINEELLTRIFVKMQNRPIVNQISKSNPIDCEPLTTYELRAHNNVISVKNGGLLKISISTKEPEDSLVINYSIPSGVGPVVRRVYLKKKAAAYERTLDIQTLYHKFYQK